MSDLYEYQAIDGSSKGPVDLVLLLRARNLGRLSNRTLVRKGSRRRLEASGLFYPLHDCYG